MEEAPAGADDEASASESDSSESEFSRERARTRAARDAGWSAAGLHLLSYDELKSLLKKWSSNSNELAAIPYVTYRVCCFMHLLIDARSGWCRIDYSVSECPRLSDIQRLVEAAEDWSAAANSAIKTLAPLFAKQVQVSAGPVELHEGCMFAELE